MSTTGIQPVAKLSLLCRGLFLLVLRQKWLEFVAAGADLDPLQVLAALSEEMLLSSGVEILSHLMCERLHRRRQGSIIRSLHKACNLSATVDRAKVIL